jgi:hypothetical protein
MRLKHSFYGLSGNKRLVEIPALPLLDSISSTNDRFIEGIVGNYLQLLSESLCSVGRQHSALCWFSLQDVDKKQRKEMEKEYGADDFISPNLRYFLMDCRCAAFPRKRRCLRHSEEGQHSLRLVQTKISRSKLMKFTSFAQQ